MDKATPAYKKQPCAEDLPKAVTMPALKCCQVVGGKLIIPNDIRQLYLSDPVFSPEWRDMLTAFDKSWSAVIGEPSPGPSPVKREKKEEESGENASSPAGCKTEATDWKSVFPGDPVTIEQLTKKYSEGVTELVGSVPGLVFMVTPGPCLFVAAPKDPVHLEFAAQPLIAHGAGSWLLGEKGKKFLTSNPGKGHPCSWTSDEVPVVLEELEFQTNHLFFSQISV